MSPVKNLVIRSVAMFCFLTAALSTTAQIIFIPNHSFEEPPVPPDVPAYPVLIGWTQTPKRADYVENPPFTWNVLAGIFANTAANSSDHIDNMDGAQAAYLFSERENGIYQVLDARYEAGYSYILTVGITASPNIPPQAGSTLALSLYYTNSPSDIVPITTTTITYNTNTFSNGTHLVDFTVRVHALNGSWLGRNIGILIKSTTTDALAGGVWDIDNVRLTAVRELITVPNYSFEEPPVPTDVPAYPFFASWQKFPKPSYWDETTMGAWDNLTGVFPNPGGGQQGHIENVDQNQAAYLFATPGSGFYQDLTNTFELNATYTITAAIIGSTAIPPTNNTPITIALYYRDEQSNMVTVASRTIPFTAENFPNPIHMVDFSANSHSVVSPAPWLGKNIGVYVASAAGPDDAGGVWDVDNIRIKVSRGVTLSFSLEGSNLRISWPSEAGVPYQLMMADRLSSAPGDYTFAPFGAEITGTGGPVSVDVPITGGRAFFEVRAPITP